MVDIRNFLSPQDYTNYRNIRAVSLMFIVLGCIITLGSLAMLKVEPEPGRQVPPAVFALLLAVAGLCGVFGGVAVRRADPRWSRLAYVMAAVYVAAFPIGTILSLVMFTGLSRYLDSVQRFRARYGQAAA